MADSKKNHSYLPILVAAGLTATILVRCVFFSFDMISAGTSIALFFCLVLGFRLQKTSWKEIRELESSLRKLSDLKIQVVEKSKLAALGEMAAGVAHEINNPLAIISGRAERIIKLSSQENINASEITSMAQSITATVTRIARTVQSLRMLYKNDSEDPFDSVDINRIVQDTMQLYLEKFKAHKIAFTFAASSRPIKISCRPSQIAQIIVNLLNNAFDAVVDLNEKWIKIELLQTEQAIQLSITDSGRGIETSLQEKIMEPFFTTKQPGKGTGLGLPIADRIMRAHQGSIALAPECPNTKFVLTFPAPSAQQDAA